MPPWAKVVLIVFAVLIVAFIALAIYANKMKKKSDASQEQIRANAQTYSILVIDKKRMKLKEAGFPQLVVDQTPKALRGAKVPVVKANPAVPILFEKLREYEVAKCRSCNPLVKLFWNLI